MKNYPNLGIQIPTTYLPNKTVELTKWAVIACDQYTSQPDYWKTVADIVGESPSTFHLILPEVYLGKPEEAERLHSTQEKMIEYLSKGVLESQDKMIYVERTVDGKTRRGIMMALDLEQYDFSTGSQSLIRATEGTILDRLPPRIRIREGASLDLPHILVLIDDPEDMLIGTVEEMKDTLPKVYDFELMQHSGHLTGRFITDSSLESKVIANLEKLAEPQTFYSKYNVGSEKGVLLFAVGDGNHSLATAKSIWEKIKSRVGMDHPARYALVEIENIHDKGLEFEPIHRVLFDVKNDPVKEMNKYFLDRFECTMTGSFEEMKSLVLRSVSNTHRFGLVTVTGCCLVSIKSPSANLPVGTLQPFLDQWVKNNGASQIDYVHGDQVVADLGSQPGNAGFYLPGMAKSELFRTVILDGVLPRKTFSMGEAHEKRFYMEARKITE